MAGNSKYVERRYCSPLARRRTRRRARGSRPGSSDRKCRPSSSCSVYFINRDAGRIDEREAPFEIAVVDDVGRLLGELAVARFAFAQRLFRPLALGDVAVVDDDAADARVVEAVDADAFDVPPRAVVVPQPERVLHGHARLLEALGEVRPERQHVVVVHPAEHVGVDDVRDRAARACAPSAGLA